MILPVPLGTCPAFVSDGGMWFIRDVGTHIPVCTESQTMRQYESSQTFKHPNFMSVHLTVILCCMFLSMPALKVHRPKEKYQAPGRPPV